MSYIIQAVKPITNELKIRVKFKRDRIVYELIERILWDNSLGFRLYPENGLPPGNGNYQIFKRFPTVREAVEDVIGWDPRYLEHTDIGLSQKLEWLEINGERVTDFEFMNFQ